MSLSHIVTQGGVLSAGAGGRPAAAKHLGVEPVTHQDQHQRRLSVQRLQLLVCKHNVWIWILTWHGSKRTLKLFTLFGILKVEIRLEQKIFLPFLKKSHDVKSSFVIVKNTCFTIKGVPKFKYT